MIEYKELIGKRVLLMIETRNDVGGIGFRFYIGVASLDERTFRLVVTQEKQLYAEGYWQPKAVCLGLQLFENDIIVPPQAISAYSLPHDSSHDYAINVPYDCMVNGVSLMQVFPESWLTWHAER